MQPDMMMEEKFKKLGELDQRLNSLGSEPMPSLSDTLTKQFIEVLKRFSKLLPFDIDMSPRALPSIQKAIASAVEAGELEDSFMVPPISTEQDVYMLIGTMDAILKDRVAMQDFKSFMQSKPTQEDQEEEDMEETPMSSLRDRLKGLARRNQ